MHRTKILSPTSERYLLFKSYVIAKLIGDSSELGYYAHLMRNGQDIDFKQTCKIATYHVSVFDVGRQRKIKWKRVCKVGVRKKDTTNLRT